jgi:hypothetical protein
MMTTHARSVLTAFCATWIFVARALARARLFACNNGLSDSPAGIRLGDERVDSFYAVRAAFREQGR